MIAGFENISEEQFETLKKSISWITVLIAGADGEIDKDETAWAKKLTKIRSYANPNRLNAFYEEVGKDFSAVIEKVINNVPTDTAKRNELLSRQLEQCNGIFSILENRTAFELYHSFKTFAKHVAKESGGFLGFFSISKEEASLIDLPMLTAIELDEPDEEE